MTDEKFQALEERVRLIESFLDAELRERQNFPRVRGGPAVNPWDHWNPWAGVADGTRIAPIVVGPIMSGRSLNSAEPTLNETGTGRGIHQGNPIKDVVKKSGDS